MGQYYEIRTIIRSEGEPFELEDGEEIVRVTTTLSGDVQVFVKSPVTFTCGYIKDDGEPCQIEVSGPGERCHHHDDKDDEEVYGEI